MSTVLVLGGYGNAGAKICDLLLAHSEHTVRIGGRHPDRAQSLADELGATNPAWPARLQSVRVDAADRANLDSALEGVDLCIAAAGTSQDATTAVRAALASAADYLDIQVSRAKADRLLAMDAEARASGVTVVTDGGFHPGVPAAMVRYADRRLGGIERARVASVIAVDWAALRPVADSTVAEMMEEFRDFSYEEYRSGRWGSAGALPTFSFPAPFGQRKAAAMGLAEMHQLTAALPGLRETGFYVGGFNPVVDYAMIPVAMAGTRIAPNLLGPPLGRLLHWGLIRFSRPPYGTVLQLDGSATGHRQATLMRISHPDAYLVTAAPTVAAALQILDGSAHRPGVHTQAMLVEPTRFFSDQSAMGINVEWLADAPQRA
ncbi:MAG: saccharopine dehydrogenase NADP-binding domain-containing protein [Actinomycetes bacterium]